MAPERRAAGSRLAALQPAQRGAAALLVLTAIIGMGGLVLAGLAERGISLDAAEDRARRLGNARDALLAYAVSYTDLYGPRGAGPGHLPCPDTDTTPNPGPNPGPNSGPNSGSSRPWQADGPNPPCGNGPVALGRLPRHISLPGHRYNFHSEPEQHFWYAVATGFINNPVNRVVNPASRGTLQVDGENEVVAVIIDPGPALPGQDRRGGNARAYLEPAAAIATGEFSRASLETGNDRLTLITMDSLRDAMQARVSAWLRDRLVATAQARCESRSPCRPYAVPCDQDHLARWLLDAPAPCGSAGSEPSPSVRAVPLAQTTWQIDPILLVSMLESVPLHSHWFVRNRWFEHVQLTVSPECHEVTREACRFRIGETLPGDRPVRIDLLPAEGEGA